MRRIYETLLREHFVENHQMIFLAGPRQVGKTTISLSAQTLTDRFIYLNWDVQEHRNLILSGPLTMIEVLKLGVKQLGSQLPFIVFDEVHKYAKWKNFLKGFYDLQKGKINIIVTGSSRLDIFRAGGDSLMGRYFFYRVHPLTVAECIRQELSDKEINNPLAIDSEKFQSLWKFGGFPEPFIKQNEKFWRQWKKLRQQQLFREDIRDLSHIQEIGQLEILAEILKQQTGQLLNLSNLAKKINVSVNTIKRWVGTLENFYYCFLIKPWTRNVTRSLIKEPKIYLWDWSEIEDPGAKAENFVAAHLLKAVHYWTDRGMGNYDLYFLRDKEKREVDFLVTKDRKPWFLVEVKHTHNHSINENLYYFQSQIKAKHAFQAVFDLEPVLKDCFQENEPIIVPAQTLLSQLV